VALRRRSRESLLALLGLVRLPAGVHLLPLSPQNGRADASAVGQLGHSREGEAVSDINKPQPPPIRSEHPQVWPMVLADMEQRHIDGARKYGIALQPHNGRDYLIDAYQEAMDLCVYLRGAIYERDGK
jgi:hypothetical protein